MYLKILFSALLLSAFLLGCGGEDCRFNAITNESLDTAYLGQDYHDTLYYDITCSYASKSAEIIEGYLPPGIQIEGSGVFYGTASDDTTKAGEYSFTVKMTICFSSNGFQYTDCSERTKEFTIVLDTIKK